MKNWISKALSNRFVARIFGETVIVVNLSRRTWRIEDRLRRSTFVARPESPIFSGFKETIVEEVRGIEFEENLEVRVDMAKEGSRDFSKTIDLSAGSKKPDPELLDQFNAAEEHCDRVLEVAGRPTVSSPGFGVNPTGEKLTEVCSRCGKKVSLFDVAYLGPKDRESTDGHPGQDLVTICLQCETEDERIERFEVNQR